MSRNTVENVIRKFGSQQRVAEALGIWQTAVSGWVRRGAIPARRQEELLQIARREGIALAPGDFFEVAEQSTGPEGPAPRLLPLGQPQSSAVTANVIQLHKEPAPATG